MTEQEKAELWQKFNLFQRSRIKSYTPKINKALQFQVNQFIAAKKLGYNDSQALEFVSSASLYEVLKPLYNDAGINYGAKTIAYLRTQKARFPIGFNRLMTELLNQYFQIDLLNIVEDITQTTKGLIRDILIAAYAAGSSFSEIINELSAIGFTQNRARVIARTETVTAANTGSYLAAKTTGLELRKVWISAQDNRTRRHPRDRYDHLHMNGAKVNYRELFNVSGEFMLHPGDRKNGANAGNICNCRCTHGYEAVRDGNGKLVRNR